MSTRVRTSVAVAAGVFVTLLVLLGGLHTPPVQSLVRRQALSLLHAQGIEATVGRLRYNLFTLTFDLDAVALTATGQRTPFFTARAVHLVLPWRIVRGALGLKALTLDGAELNLVRGSDGRLNLPASGGTGPGLARLALGQVQVRHGRARYADAAADVHVDAGGITVDLAASNGRSAGTVQTGQGLMVRAAGTTLAGSLQGGLAWDGTALTVSGLRFTSAPLDLLTTGRLGVLGTDTSLALNVGGTVALSAASPLFGLTPAATGTVTVTSEVAGTPAAPVATVTLTSPQLDWPPAVAREVAVRARVTTAQLTVEALTLRLGEGQARAEGQFGLDTGTGHATATWSGIPLGALATLGLPRVSATRISGRATLSVDTPSPIMAATLNAEVSATTPGAGQGTASLRLQTRGPDWRGRADLQLRDAATPAVAVASASLAGHVPEAGVSASSLRGSVQASAADLARLVGMADRLGLWSASWPRPEAGRLDTTLSLGGTVQTPSVSGPVALDGARVAGIGPMAGTLALTRRGQNLELTGITATLGANHLAGALSVRGPRGTLGGTLALSLTDAVPFGQALAPWAPTGQLDAQLELLGTTAAPEVHSRISGSGLAMAGQALGTLAVEATVTPTTLTLTAGTLRQPGGGTLTASGTYALGSGQHVVAVDLNGLRLTPLTLAGDTWPVDALLSGQFQSTGTREAPVGSGHIEATALRWDTARLDQATADLTLRDGGANLRVTAPALALALDGTVSPTAPYAYDLRVTAADTTIASLLTLLGTAVPPAVRPLTGQLAAQAHLTGTLDDLSTLSAEATLDRLVLHAGDAALQLEAPATVRYARSTLTVNQLRVRSGTTVAELQGTLGAIAPQGLTLSLDGPLVDAQPWLAAFGAQDGVSLGGRLHLTARAEGEFDQPILSADARLEEGQLVWPGYPAVTRAVATLSLADGVLTAPVVEATWQEATLSAQARVPLSLLRDWLPASLVTRPRGADASASLQARLAQVTPAVLAPFVDASTLASLTGVTGVALDLRADAPSLDQVSGTVQLTSLDLHAEGVPIAQVRPTRLDVARGIVRVTDWSWTVAGSPVQVTGSAGLSAEAPLDLHVDGALDLRVLSLFVPMGAIDGTGTLALSVGGTAAAPVAEGTIEVTDGELRMTDPRIGLSEAHGRLVLHPDRVTVDGMEGTLNGGRVTLRGELAYRNLSLTGGTLTVEADHVALDVPTGMRSEVNAALTLTAGDRFTLGGRIDVLQGAYREPLSLAAALATAARQRVIMTDEGADASLLGTVDLNIAIASTEDLMVDNNYGRLELGLDVRLVGTAAAPSVVGRAAIREGGVLFLGGRTYLIDRGVIDFSDPRAIVPQLDLSGRTRVDGTNDAGSPTTYDITLAITGTPETLTTVLTSVPDRPQADIVSLLATGRLADQVGGAEGAIARDQFLGYLSGETLGFAARAIGFDSIRFERGATQDTLTSDASLAGEVNPAQRLTVSRRISGVAELTVSQNLRDTSRLTWIAALMPRRSVELRAVSRDDRSRTYEVRHDISLGGPADTATPRAAATLRVSAVVISGTPGVPEGTIRRQLHLSVGDRFDFYRWQQDRDRLRRYFLERGYREVRISARQAPAPMADGTAGVALAYAVTAGPPTTITVEGDALPDKVVRDLGRIWSEAIVDIGLTGDVSRAVQRHLAGEGYLRARVRVTRVAPDAARPAARLLVRVGRGPRSLSRRLEVTGASHLSQPDIDTVAAQVGVDAWLRPASLAEALTQRYRQEGLLAATVSAGPARYDGTTAVLPVRIDEGRTFVVGRVALTGTTSRGEEAARRAFGLATGAPFTPEVLRQARLALGRAYATDGFNAMTDETGTRVDRMAGTVDVSVAVREGTRQRLSTITVSGADGVSPHTVTDALQLTPGSPVDMNAWYAGRRRLFQTGLFRRVELTPVPVPGAVPGPTEEVSAELTLVRVRPWRLRYGVNVTDEAAPLADQGRTFGGGLSTTLERQGLFGRPGSGLATLRYNNDQRVARGAVTWPTLFGRPLSTRVFLSRSRDVVSGENILAFITDKTIVTAEQRVTLGTGTHIAYAYQFERNHVFDPDANPSDPFALDERWRQARLTASFVFDRRSDPIEPTRGVLHSSTVEYGLEALGRNGRFLKYALQQLAFAPLTRGVVSASAVRLNIGAGFGQSLIQSERFYAGGTTSVRGYADDSLGGYDFFGDPVPGQASLVLNQEVRFPLLRAARGAVFIDAGNVFAQPSDLSLSGLKLATGAGLRLTTPVGLFRIDLATPLPRQGRQVRWTFGFGHIF